MALLASEFTETCTAVHKFKPCLTQWAKTVVAEAIAFNTAMPMLIRARFNQSQGSTYQANLKLLNTFVSCFLGSHQLPSRSLITSSGHHLASAQASSHTACIGTFGCRPQVASVSLQVLALFRVHHLVILWSPGNPNLLFHTQCKH
jgi:hypothetical protein